MANYEYATLMARAPKAAQGSISLVTALGEDPINTDSGELRWLMKALGELGAEQWEPVGPSTVAIFPNEVAVTSYLLRRPARGGEPQVF